MQAQQEVRVSAPPLTATFVLFVGLAFGCIAGYAIGAAETSSTAIQATQRVVAQFPAATQRVVPHFPAATQPPVREPQNSYD